jgi:hypothetical protein
LPKRLVLRGLSLSSKKIESLGLLLELRCWLLDLVETAKEVYRLLLYRLICKSKCRWLLLGGLSESKLICVLLGLSLGGGLHKSELTIVLRLMWLNETKLTHGRLLRWLGLHETKLACRRLLCLLWLYEAKLTCRWLLCLLWLHESE